MWRIARYLSWLVHAAVLALIVAYIGLGILDSTPDANLGLALGVLALGVMGVPWSLPLLVSDRVSAGSAVFVAVAAGGAMVNLVLHGVALRWWRERRGQR
jgi:hypothetical protein